MIVHTSAIVFRSIDFQESSKIVTFFTKEHGKIALIVRGAKKPKSKFAGLMDVGNILDVVYYHKNSRSVQVLTEASLLDKTLNLRLDFEKMATATSSVELISQLLHEGEINHPLFDFTRKFLLWLDSTQFPPQMVFPYLQIRLIELMGLGLQFEIAEDEPATSACLNLETGQIALDGNSAYSYKLTQNQFRYVSLAMQTRNSRIFEIAFRPGELKALIQHLDRYLKYHIEGLKDRKSDAIFEQLLQE
jgi:DNA repair protein RecO